jgi:hypothetical protein
VVSVNRVILVGRCSQYGPKIAWTDQGKPQTSFTLVLEEGTYKTFVPVLCVGAGAEAAAEDIAANELLLVDGRLSWKAGRTKDAGKLVVVCFGVERLAGATAAVELQN